MSLLWQGARVDVVETAGATLVALMATDAWQQAREGVVMLWRRFRPVQAEEITLALDETREEVLAARQDQDEQGEADLVRDWDRRLRRILEQDPAVAQHLQQLLDEVRGSLPRDQQPTVPAPVFHTHVSGNGRVYNAGRDQHIHER
ncbi:hypothetical protein J2Z21_008452 [Streptomyces griseochromogenes]|uniref:Uncharacterized protein n=2 Tax=Streptomyces griseochromogenes TaxID=68214 RepID=A0ABS4M714_9ACTN|nr:hypothetical protein [Streptomyces griseochromogenes]MBP2055438.1 hypothetical protein [Streptomyces griseochromogenes]